MGDNRPSLSFEYEVALALIDTAQLLSFDEDDDHPPIVGSFEVVTCTKTASCEPPHDPGKPIKCGYNPASHVIPAGTVPGRFTFTTHDQAELNRVMAYFDNWCVARVVAKHDATVLRTFYCCYFKPKLSLEVPGGDEPGQSTIEGTFTHLGGL